MRPALRIRRAAEELAHLRRRREQPQKLHVVAGVDFVHGRGDQSAAIKAFHVLFYALRRPGSFRQRNVEIRLLGHHLVRARRIHRSKSQSAHEGRSLLDDRQDPRRNPDDMVFFDVGAQAAQHIPKRLQEHARRGVILCRLFQNLPRRLARIDLFRHVPEGLLILPQIGHADLQQAIERDVEVLIVEQLFAIIVGADAEIAVRLGL